MREHFQLILDGLDVGLDSATETPDFPFKSVLTDLPTLIEGLPPPTAVRAIVTIDEIPYEVVIRAAGTTSADPPPPDIDPEQPRECPSSSHGMHTPVGGKCIGCGAAV
jgi:hypothetical protein